VCIGTVDQKIYPGDYSLEGYEQELVIERKGKITELAANIHQDRFMRELEKMEFVTYPWIVCEFDFVDIMMYPFCKGVPFAVRKKVKFTGKYFLKKVTELMFKYKTKWLFVGSKENDGLFTALGIFKRFWELQSNE